MTREEQADRRRRPSGLLRRAARALRLAASDPAAFRTQLYYKLRNPKLFQPVNATADDRHPTLFAALRDILGGDGAHTILSFGCSTGEEVFTLRRYFPRAAIKGLDINPHNIGRAQKRLAREPDAGLSFAVANASTGEAAAFYDAVLCLSVLRHTALDDPRIQSAAAYIRFEDFARTATDLARCVRPGGLLVVRHSNFRFGDVPASTHFAPLACDALTQTRIKTPIFGPDNRRLAGVAYDDVIFRKMHPARSA